MFFLAYLILWTLYLGNKSHRGLTNPLKDDVKNNNLFKCLHLDPIEFHLNT